MLLRVMVVLVIAGGVLAGVNHHQHGRATEATASDSGVQRPTNERLSKRQSDSERTRRPLHAPSPRRRYSPALLRLTSTTTSTSTTSTEASSTATPQPIRSRTKGPSAMRRRIMDMSEALVAEESIRSHADLMSGDINSSEEIDEHSKPVRTHNLPKPKDRSQDVNSTSIASRKRRPSTPPPSLPTHHGNPLSPASALTMSDSLDNYFRPLGEVPADHLLPFIHFGKKLSTKPGSPGPVVKPLHYRHPTASTNSLHDNPSTSPLTTAIPQKTTERSEDEKHDDMDVSVVHPVVEKNKPAPARKSPSGQSLLLKSLYTHQQLHQPQPNEEEVAAMRNLVVVSTDNSSTSDKESDEAKRRRLATHAAGNGTTKKVGDEVFDSVTGRRKIVSITKRLHLPNSTTVSPESRKRLHSVASPIVQQTERDENISTIPVHSISNATNSSVIESPKVVYYPVNSSTDTVTVTSTDDQLIEVTLPSTNVTSVEFISESRSAKLTVPVLPSTNNNDMNISNRFTSPVPEMKFDYSNDTISTTAAPLFSTPFSTTDSDVTSTAVNNSNADEKDLIISSTISNYNNLSTDVSTEQYLRSLSLNKNRALYKKLTTTSTTESAFSELPDGLIELSTAAPSHAVSDITKNVSEEFSPSTVVHATVPTPSPVLTTTLRGWHARKRNYTLHSQRRQPFARKPTTLHPALFNQTRSLSNFTSSMRKYNRSNSNPTANNRSNLSNEYSPDIYNISRTHFLSTQRYKLKKTEETHDSLQLPSSEQFVDTTPVYNVTERTFLNASYETTDLTTPTTKIITPVTGTSWANDVENISYVTPSPTTKILSTAVVTSVSIKGEWLDPATTHSSSLWPLPLEAQALDGGTLGNDNSNTSERNATPEKGQLTNITAYNVSEAGNATYSMVKDLLASGMLEEGTDRPTSNISETEIFITIMESTSASPASISTTAQKFEDEIIDSQNFSITDKIVTVTEENRVFEQPAVPGTTPAIPITLFMDNKWTNENETFRSEVNEPTQETLVNLNEAVRTDTVPIETPSLNHVPVPEVGINESVTPADEVDFGKTELNDNTTQLHTESLTTTPDFSETTTAKLPVAITETLNNVTSTTVKNIVEPADTNITLSLNGSSIPWLVTINYGCQNFSGKDCTKHSVQHAGADDSGSWGMQVAVYVLVAICVLPLAVASFFIFRFLAKKRQKFMDESDTCSEISCPPRGCTNRVVEQQNKLPRLPPHLGWDQEKSVSPAGNMWEVPRSKLRLQTVLGQGNFGQVLKAEADDICGPAGSTRLVAVKTVKEDASQREKDDLLREMEIMKQLGAHPNVVTLLGCCTEQEPHLLIMEYVMYGKLLAYLRDHRTRRRYFNFCEDGSDALTSRDITVFAYCVARGMEYLVSKGIIHRDLAARNVLVDHNKLCKVADFGMSRSVRELGEVYEQRHTKGALPIRWMAPESLLYRIFTHKSDVWSFGILMWEIVTLGSTPYPGLTAREVVRIVRDGQRLERPSHCRPELFRLASRCWHNDPTRRPSFSELKRDLAALVEDPRHSGGFVDLDAFADHGYCYGARGNNNNMTTADTTTAGADDPEVISM